MQEDTPSFSTTLPHIPIPHSRQKTLGHSGPIVLSLSHCPRLSTLGQGKPTLSLKTFEAYKGPWLTQMLKHPGPGGRVRFGYFSE